MCCGAGDGGLAGHRLPRRANLLGHCQVILLLQCGGSRPEDIRIPAFRRSRHLHMGRWRSTHPKAICNNARRQENTTRQEKDGRCHAGCPQVRGLGTCAHQEDQPYKQNHTSGKPLCQEDRTMRGKRHKSMSTSVFPSAVCAFSVTSSLPGLKMYRRAAPAPMAWLGPQMRGYPLLAAG